MRDATVTSKDYLIYVIGAPILLIYGLVVIAVIWWTRYGEVE